MIERFGNARPWAALAGALLLAAAPLQANAQELAGDADRGKAAYTHEYKCYACHGYDAQTGERRLVPLNYTQDGFITFVRNSPLPLMPAYPDMPPQALADVYAYLEMIPQDAPEIDDIPLLRELRDAKLSAFGD
jgi:mono/diheme cytochrome c family protein